MMEFEEKSSKLSF